jgi:predicted TIM-barrel fold metal-dependent hydrolase
VKDSNMIVDFQHHFIPREMAKEPPAGKAGVHFDKDGVPSMTPNAVLYDLDEHIVMMDTAGIDAAFLTVPPAMCASLEVSRLANDKTQAAVNDYPGRFIGGAHINPLHGADALRELNRCSTEFGFPGVVITSEIDGVFIDDPALEPFWKEATRLGMFVFIHPCLKLNFSQPLNAYDLARSVGREFSLIAATVRLIDSGLLDRHPALRIHMSHLGGGIATMLGRIRKFQDREHFGTAGHPVHGKLPARDFDHYLRERLVFDTAGMCGEIKSVQAALLELPASRCIFGTDYPQEIRDTAGVKKFVDEMRALGTDGERILSGNNGLLLKN